MTNFINIVTSTLTGERKSVIVNVDKIKLIERYNDRAIIHLDGGTTIDTVLSDFDESIKILSNPGVR